jgi:hypothetical protein
MPIFQTRPLPNIVLASFEKGSASDAENIRAALDIVAKGRE